jgi:hypothetical protein
MLKKLLLVGALVAMAPIAPEKKVELYQIAKSAIKDLGGFCTRNPGTCVKGKQAIGELTRKVAQNGSNILHEGRAASTSDPVATLLDANPAPVLPTAMANKTSPVYARIDQQETAFFGHQSDPASQPVPVSSNERFPSYGDKQKPALASGTLSTSDLQPAWGG